MNDQTTQAIVLKNEMSNIVKGFIYNTLLGTLTDRELRIANFRLKDIFGFDVTQLTLKQIAEREGLSQSRIRQIVSKIISKIEIRAAIINELLMPNLPIVDRPVESLGRMSVRIVNSLKNEEIKTVQHLIEKTDDDLMRISNFGLGSLNKIKELLACNGLNLQEKKVSQTTPDKVERFTSDMKAYIYFNQKMAEACNEEKPLTVYPENFFIMPKPESVTMQKQIDAAADALRRFEQSSKRLNDWRSLPKSTKEKWREKVRVMTTAMEVANAKD